MSYLDLLSRSAMGPATDYHLCLLKQPDKNEQTRQFFVGQEVTNLWHDMGLLELELFNFERKKARLSGDLDQCSDLRSNDRDTYRSPQDEANLHWLALRAQYESVKQTSSLFQVSDDQLATIDSDISTLEEKSDDIQTRPEAKNSSREFLLSIAGIFSSGAEDTSDNAKSLIQEALLEKYRS